ncbi:DUF952 domain-containing protein [Devosia sp.]|uniref:DUF952 domain-containing protein n=1 Tax=Devosia sp. TaxID=1871048 RepID=UPI003A8F7000
MTDAKDPQSQKIFKVTRRAVFEQSRESGQFIGMPIDLEDGYVHFSTASQLVETLRLHFAGADDLVLFAVDTDALGAALKWEASRGGALFPHLYGELPMTAVGEASPIAVAADGSVELPEWAQ